MATTIFEKKLPHSDVMLVFQGGMTLYAHKSILSCCFDFFANMFEIADCDLVEMRHCPEEVTAERVCMLLSHMYGEYLLPGVRGVRQMCTGNWYVLDQVGKWWNLFQNVEFFS